ncbi:MAG TPA: CGNR zinc finger domain-containing protein, partial [Lysobacter sp.]
HTGAFLPKDLALLRKQALANPREAGSALRRLRDLRECVHDLVAALARHRRPDNAVVAKLESHWKAATGAARLQPPPTPQPDWSAMGSGLDLLRHVAAWHAVAFLDSGALPRTRVCDGHDCGWLFVDLSKGGRRRWCDMRTCGNVAKARRHQHRRQSSS